MTLIEQHLEKIATAAERGLPRELLKTVKAAQADGLAAQHIIEGGLLEGLRRVSANFMASDIYVPDVMQAANATNIALRHLAETENGFKPMSLGKVLMATVEGDQHNLGKNIVGFMMDAKGFEVIDLGVNIRSEEIVKAVLEHKPGILALSSLMTTTMGKLRDTIKLLDESGLRDGLIVMVGGAPVREDFSVFIGADAYADDAYDAANRAVKLIQAR